MQFYLILIVSILSVQGQNNVDENTKKIIDEIFDISNQTGSNNQSPTVKSNSDIDDFFSSLEMVPESTPGSVSAIERCGQGRSKGMKKCVVYHQCDWKTNTIIQSGSTDGVGIIDIRFGENACSHPLEVCCTIPQGGLNQTTLPPIITTLTPPTIAPTTPKPSYCGIRNVNGIDFSIKGNQNNEAEYAEFPWMVAIMSKNYEELKLDGPLICGGSLITPNLVLTAAHCVDRYKSSELTIRAGEWDTQTTNERVPHQDRGISQIIVHPEFNSGNLWNDFALVVLDSPIAKADSVGTICLPEQSQMINSRECFVSGWGKREFGKKGKRQAILKKIQLPIVDRYRCESDLQKTRLGFQFQLHESFTCAGGELGKDACTGDGGSPLVCPDPTNPKRYVQAGIVAWGIGCGSQNVPGVYGDVSKFRSWIDENVARLNIDNSAYRF